MNAHSILRCGHSISWLGRSVLSRTVAAGLLTLFTSQGFAADFSSAALSAVQAQADAGDATAQTELGLRLVDGKGVRKDLVQAAEWFRKSAMQGDASGQLELGVMYVNGEGVTQDLREAYAWYTLAQRQGNPQAKEYLEDLNRSLSSDARAKARERADALALLIESSRQRAPKHGAHRQIASGQSPVKAEPARAAAPPAARPGEPVRSTAKEAGSKNYMIWNRVRVKDENGFNGPVEAYSILLPKDWKTEGGVRWVINTTCPAEAVQNRFTATSADGAFRLEVFPLKSWQWFDDPMMLQINRNNAASGSAGCPLARPFDASQYLEQVFVAGDLSGARLVSHERNDPMSRLMLEQARKDNALFQANGVRVESRPSAEIGRLRWPDGRIGIAFCAVAQTVSFLPNMIQGGTYASYQSHEHSASSV